MVWRLVQGGRTGSVDMFFYSNGSMWREFVCLSLIYYQSLLPGVEEETNGTSSKYIGAHVVKCVGYAHSLIMAIKLDEPLCFIC